MDLGPNISFSGPPGATAMGMQIADGNVAGLDAMAGSKNVGGDPAALEERLGRDGCLESGSVSLVGKNRRCDQQVC